MVKGETVTDSLDPEDITVKIIDDVSSMGLIGAYIQTTLVTNRITLGDDNKMRSEYVVASRLRMSPNMAERLARELMGQVEFLRSQKPDKAN